MIMRLHRPLARSDWTSMEWDSAGPTRVVTVEDDPRYRASLEVLLRYSGDFVLEESFAAPAEAFERLASVSATRGQGPGWQLVLMDLDLPDMSGVECTRRIKAALPGVPVIVLTVFEDRASIIEAICAGADGYLLKRTPADDLLVQLRAVLAGGSPLSAGVAKTVLDVVRQVNGRTSPRSQGTPETVQLTDRELEVLACLVRGMSYKAAARALGISIDTVRSHIRGVYGKLQVHSVAEAVSRALREGLV
jgi:DNA-binding NarL/FixJ family response regulator